MSPAPRVISLLLLCALFSLPSQGPADNSSISDPCARPSPGSDLPEPPEVRSVDGMLDLKLTIRNFKHRDGSVHYCYRTPQGAIAPTLRLHPGDWLVLHLYNDLRDWATPARQPLFGSSKQKPYDAGNPPMCKLPKAASTDPCTSGAMTATATNLHFHGFTVPAACHQDDVLMTSVPAGSDPFEYRFRIPDDQPPGLYWYHPHIHGFSSQEVSGGASGAMIIEGIERANPDLAGLTERVLVIRDQELLNPNAPPAKSEPVVPKMMIDRDGDAANTGTGYGTPARDLSVNFVAVPYPDYPVTTLRVKPGQRELWRVLNASSITYLNLQLLDGRIPQTLGVVAIDGAPINAERSPGPAVIEVDHIGIPPGSRAEFVIQTPPAGAQQMLVTRFVDTGRGGENDPNRALISVVGSPDVLYPPATLPDHPSPLPPPSRPWLGNVQPVRVRKLFFSERLENPADPNSATTFFITEDGQEPTPFDPGRVDITAHQGDVEDWVIENRSNELHAFHIHQLHFQLIDWSGLPMHETFLRDTVNLPYFDGRALAYPSVRIRMDFRDPNTVGTFVFHCHLLEHEDGGMMGVIRVLPKDSQE